MPDAAIDYDGIFGSRGRQGSAASTPPASTDGGDGSGGAGAGQSDSGNHSAGESFAAGVVQGTVRDPAETITSIAAPVINWVDRNVPFLGALDRWAGTTPENIAAQSEAARQRYGNDLSFQAGRIGGNVLVGAAIPGAGLVGDVGAAAAGAGRPLLSALARGAASGAYAGGTGSALVSGGYGENPLTAGLEGAVGGGVLGGAGAALARPIANNLTNIANRLGVDLSAGQARGGVLRWLEDLTEPFPLSGAGQKGAQQQSQFANVIQRNMGAPETGNFTLPEAEAAMQAAGTRQGNAARALNIDASVPAGTPTVPGTAAPNLVDRLNEVVADAERLGPSTPQAYGARNLRQQIFSSLANNGGTMPGRDFQSFVGYRSALDQMAKSTTPEVANVARDVRDALSTAANNTASNAPGALDAYRAAQLQYKAGVLAREVTKQTGDFADTTPAALKQAIFNIYKNQMTNTGVGYDLPDLARLIRLIPKYPSSGTAQRQAMYGGAAALGSYFGSPAMAAAGLHAALPYAAMTAASRMSRFGPGMGIPGVGNALAAVGNYANPLVPRILGENLGKGLTGNWTWPQQ